MRAVNLIPADARRGAGGAAGRSGGAAYVLLGALGVLVVLMGLWVTAGRQADERRGELAGLQQEVVAAEAEAQRLAPYTSFAQLRERRVQTVSSIAASRFDWSHALREISRVVPRNTWLTQLSGTVAPGVTVEGGTSAAGGLRGAVQAPAIEITGCTTSQREVARIMARMRQVDGVQRVSLAASEKSADGGGGAASGGGSAGSGDCRAGSAKRPQFALVVFFAAVPAAAAPAAPAPATTPTAQGSTP